MAYNYYQPIGYQPQNMYQYQQQPMQLQQPVTVPNGIIWVNDMQEAAMYPVAPNSAVALWDKTTPSIYLKKSDMTGKPMMQVFDLVERKEPPKTSNNAQDALYATKTDLQGVLTTVNELRHELEEMRLKTQNRASDEGVSE